MTQARSVAQLIAARVSSEGSIAGIAQHGRSSADGMRFASDHDKVEEYRKTEPFRDVEVLSIVYSDGQQRELPAASIPPEVIIYATNIRKHTNSLIAALPDEIDGVKVRVEKTAFAGVDDKEVELIAPDSRHYVREGRIACGSSCATARGFPGTMGAIVKLDREDDDGSRFILSCNHVLAACSQLGLGMPILSPATNDAKTKGPPPLSIARLHEAIELKQGHWSHGSICEIDAAIGKLIDPSYITSWQGDETGYETPLEVADPIGGMRVKKFGRSTGLTHGTVTGKAETHWAVPYDTKEYKATLWFKNFSVIQAQRTPFALPGDSGSLVVTEDDKAAVGLLFSTNSIGNLAQIIPLSQVLKALKVSLVSGH